jgi:hypothetical protein
METSLAGAPALTTRIGAPVLLLSSALLPPPNAKPRGGASRDGLAKRAEATGGAGDASEPSSLVSVKVGESSSVLPALRPLGCRSMVSRPWRISLNARADTGAETCRMNDREFAEYGPAPGERVSFDGGTYEGD